MEFGSNAGLFLRLATEAGYKAIGFERDKKDCGIARQYRDNLRLNYKIVETQVDEKLDYLADITLLANFHYHQHVSEFVNLLDSMETKTCYVLIVSVNDIKEPHWRAQPDQKNAETYFPHLHFILPDSSTASTFSTVATCSSKTCNTTPNIWIITRSPHTSSQISYIKKIFICLLLRDYHYKVLIYPVIQN